MGGSLSVEETAYKQLDRELKGQNGDSNSSLRTFLDSCPSFDRASDRDQSRGSRNVPEKLLELIRDSTTAKTPNRESLMLQLQTMERVMSFSGAYVAAFDLAGDIISTLLDVLRKKEKTGPECCAAAIDALDALLFRRLCRTNQRFDSYQDGFLDVFMKENGFTVITTCIEWNEDASRVAFRAACNFFIQILNARCDQFTASQVTTALKSLLSSCSFIAKQTCDGPSEAGSLLKVLLLCCNRDQLHKLQTMFLESGFFIFHLHRVLVGGDALSVELSQDMVVATVMDSADGKRTLGRIFPAPLVKRLEVDGEKYRFRGVSNRAPAADGPADTRLLDEMVLKMLPLSANWANFWEALKQESDSYDFIWNRQMLQQAVSSLRGELQDMQESLWDYDGFRVQYPQLQKHVCVDGYYLQQMISAYDDPKQTIRILNPDQFVRNLCDLYVVSRSCQDRRALLYLILRVVQGEEQAVKNFPVMRYLCFLLEDPALDPVLQDLALRILEKLCIHQRNTEQFQDHHGVGTITRILSEAIYGVLQRVPRVADTSAESSLSRSGRSTHMEGMEWNSVLWIGAQSDSDEDLPTEQGAVVHKAPSKPVNEGLSCEIAVLEHVERVNLILEILRNACHSMNRICVDLAVEPVLSRILRVPFVLKEAGLMSVVLEILDVTLSAATRCQSTLFRSGLFQILLLCLCNTQLSTEMSSIVGRLLEKYHYLQNTTDVEAALGDPSDRRDVNALVREAGEDREQLVAVARRASFLRFFLPPALIALLTREGASPFYEVFTAELTENSDVLWSADLRLHLEQELKYQITPYLDRIMTDPAAEWEYSVPLQVQYPAIDDKLCVTNVFLEAFLKEECSVPYTVEPYQFLNDLIRELEMRLNAVFNMNGPEELIYKDIAMILKSLLKLLKTKKEVSRVDQKAFSVLGRCLTADLAFANNVEMAEDALEVIMEALQPESFGKPSSVNLCECADAGCVAQFDKVLDTCSSDALFEQLSTPDTPLARVMLGSLKCLCLFAKKTTPRPLESLVAQPHFVHSLIQYTYLDCIELAPTVGLQVMEAFALFLQDEKLLEIVVNTGGLISFLQITLCLEIPENIYRSIVDTAVICLKRLAGVDDSVSSPTIVVDAMTRLLTPGLMKALRDDSFLEKMRSPNVRHPLLIWNTDMATQLVQVLADEEDTIYNEQNGSGYWDVNAFCQKGTYITVYPNLQAEFIVDEVFLDPFLNRPDTELTDPTPDHFMKALMMHVVQLQGAQDLVMSRRQDRSTMLESLLVSLRSLKALLACHPALHSSFIYDSNIHHLFDMLLDTSISWDLQGVLLQLLQLAVDTPTGCDVMASFVPSLRQILQSDCSRAYMPVLTILEQFASSNDQVVQMILSSGIVLALLDMILFFEKEYDGDVQDAAVILLGKLMQNFKYGEDVRKYLVALFTPLFKGVEEKAEVLASCHDDPSAFLDVLDTSIYTPTVYWDENVKNDLRDFLRNEARTKRTTDQDYQYGEAEVAKRIKPSRKTLNKQLVVADIFVVQYVKSPFCTMNAPAFLRGLIDLLQEESRADYRDKADHREVYKVLVNALFLFIMDLKDTQLNDSLYTDVVKFCIYVLRENIVVMQEKVVSLLEHLMKQPVGMKEFERNNSAVAEESYVSDLLAVCAKLEPTVQAGPSGNAYRVAELLLLLVRNPVLRETCYHAGILFYAFASVLGFIGEIESTCTASVFLRIIGELVKTMPEAETDALEFTTSQFRGRFTNEPSIVYLFIRQPHEAYVDENLIRMWSVEAREALCEVAKEEVARLNEENEKGMVWDRVCNRFTMESVKNVWMRFTRNTLNSSQAQLRRSSEATAIRRRENQTMFERQNPREDEGRTSM